MAPKDFQMLLEMISLKNGFNLKRDVIKHPQKKQKTNDLASSSANNDFHSDIVTILKDGVPHDSTVQNRDALFEREGRFSKMAQVPDFHHFHHRGKH